MEASYCKLRKDACETSSITHQLLPIKSISQQDTPVQCQRSLTSVGIGDTSQTCSQKAGMQTKRID